MDGPPTYEPTMFDSVMDWFLIAIMVWVGFNFLLGVWFLGIYFYLSWTQK